MPQFQRSTWTALFFLGVFTPFAFGLLSLVLGSKGTAHAAPEATAAASAPGTTRPISGPAVVAPPGRASSPMFGAGDERTLWVAHPVLFEGKDPAFELMARMSNSRTWNVIRDVRGVSTVRGHPINLAVVSPPPTVKGRAAPVVFIEGGDVRVFTASGNTPRDNLPRNHQLLAAAGSQAGVFAITLGPPSPSTTQPGDVLNTQMAPANEIEPSARSLPATTTSRPAAAPPQVNAYWMKDAHWTMLPALGASQAHRPAAGAAQVESEATPADVPSSSALVTLGYVPQRLVLAGVEPSNPGVLVARGLEYKVDGATWTRPVISHLPHPVPAHSRLLTVAVDQALYVFWPTASATPEAIELHGGRLVTDARKPGTDLTLPTRNFLPPLLLKGVGNDVNPSTDVVVGPAENSIAAVVNTKNNALVSFLFNDRGTLTSGPDPVETQAPRRDVQFARNIAMLLLILMLTLSFWQWRQRPGPLKLPAGMTIARPGVRAIAFAIDLALPYVIVCLGFGLWEDEGYVKLLSAMMRSILNFDVLFSSPPLLTMLGIYLAHVTIGELFFRRSIGKAMTGLQVLMIDGKPPTVAATVVRNLIRLPELLLGILVIYVMISPHRQRLGDLLGRTLVIAQKPPELPADVDGE